MLDHDMFLRGKNVKDSSSVQVSEGVTATSAYDNQQLAPSKAQNAATTLRRTSTRFLEAVSIPIIRRSSEGSRNHSPFLDILSTDLHYAIATKYLNFDTLLALRQTCRAMHALLTPDKIRRVRDKLVQQYLEDEVRQFRAYRTLYPRNRFGHLWELLHDAFDFRLVERPAKELRCYACLQLKPVWNFVERMSTRGTGLGAKSAHNRMCKDCMRRYRDVEGSWWKENWVKRSDTAKIVSRGKRVRRWVFQGQSLVNPPEDVGVCAACGTFAFELWWGCVTCFEMEQKARREEDLDEMEISGLERKVVDAFDKWRFRREIKCRKRQAKRETRAARSRILARFGFIWIGPGSNRRAAFREWRASKTGKPASPFMPPPKKVDRGWKALDQIPPPDGRREARCAPCWIASAPRRMYMHSFGFEGVLEKERWCKHCRQEQRSRHERREERKFRLDGYVAAQDPFEEEEKYGLDLLFDQY
ncbi:uncharacterized protein PV06_10169 [Exophiala oligosperma]|uniref:Uncharacterized protein n=1 Tax=Exophiala oligosperma TaxID=215243 RepID=A0A0D2AB23_9EURO|nr:uncharacterized protein PV06_10169 [Exophiala oligosperma]KIW37516.1 hypothetical protein PV06_10169 [Exophiala oligosperma]